MGEEREKTAVEGRREASAASEVEDKALAELARPRSPQNPGSSGGRRRRKKSGPVSGSASGSARWTRAEPLAEPLTGPLSSSAAEKLSS